MRKLILRSTLCPGDILTLTVALESLHATYPGQFLTDVRTPCPAIWEHNPHITPIADDDPDATLIECEYPTIHQSDSRPVRFIEGYTTDLGNKIERPLVAAVNHPVVYLSDQERTWVNQIREHISGGAKIPFWMVSAGIKSDFTAKQWPVENYQEVIDQTRGRIQWVQIGEAGHDHPDLRGVIDMRGKTDLRQLIRLASFAEGGLGPVTLLQHLMAAFSRPYICLLGGREPVNWVTYPLQHTLHTIGLLSCCQSRACWRSRVIKRDDGKREDDSLCEWPVLGLSRPVAKCMAMIHPVEVLSVISKWSQ